MWYGRDKGYECGGRRCGCGGPVRPTKHAKGVDLGEWGGGDCGSEYAGGGGAGVYGGAGCGDQAGGGGAAGFGRRAVDALFSQRPGGLWAPVAVADPGQTAGGERVLPADAGGRAGLRRRADYCRDRAGLDAGLLRRPVPAVPAGCRRVRNHHHDPHSGISFRADVDG